MTRIGRGSGKWNMMIEEMINMDFIVFRTYSVGKMNAMVEKFGELYEILDVTFHRREDYVETEIIYKN